MVLMFYFAGLDDQLIKNYKFCSLEMKRISNIKSIKTLKNCCLSAFIALQYAVTISMEVSEASIIIDLSGQNHSFKPIINSNVKESLICTSSQLRHLTTKLLCWFFDYSFSIVSSHTSTILAAFQCQLAVILDLSHIIQQIL